MDLSTICFLALSGYKETNNIENTGKLTDYKHVTKLKIIFDNLNSNYSFSNINENEISFKQCFIRLIRGYLEKVNLSVEKMNSYPNYAQRSPEWYAARNEKLSASSISAVLKPNSSSYNELKFEKIGVQLKPFGFSEAIMHGVMFEQVSQVLYETRNNVTIIEFGCIPHSEYNYIGASPDGVVYLEGVLDPNINKNYTWQQIALHGRLVEIKNPKSRVINNSIPHKYEIQINVQQEVCNLPCCDYLETNYDFYDDIYKFLEDTYDINQDNVTVSDYVDITENDDNTDFFENNTKIENKNIPWVNLSSDGKEKGILIKFSNSNTRSENEEYKYEGVLMNIKNPYDLETYEQFKREKQIEFGEKNMEIEQEYFWKIKIYDVKTVWFDKLTWEEIKRYSKLIWNEIMNERKMTDLQLINKYPNKLEIIDSSQQDMNDDNIDTTLYRKRNIKKKEKVRVTYDFTD